MRLACCWWGTPRAVVEAASTTWRRSRGTTRQLRLPLSGSISRNSSPAASVGVFDVLEAGRYRPTSGRIELHFCADDTRRRAKNRRQRKRRGPEADTPANLTANRYYPWCVRTICPCQGRDERLPRGGGVASLQLDRESSKLGDNASLAHLRIVSSSLAKAAIPRVGGPPGLRLITPGTSNLAVPPP
jgi:hypothetical protein